MAPPKHQKPAANAGKKGNAAPVSAGKQQPKQAAKQAAPAAKAVAPKAAAAPKAAPKAVAQKAAPKALSPEEERKRRLERQALARKMREEMEDEDDEEEEGEEFEDDEDDEEFDDEDGLEEGEEFDEDDEVSGEEFEGEEFEDEEEGEEFDEDEEEDDDDGLDIDEEEDEDDEDGAWNDAGDDFETKAQKYMQQMQEQGRIAEEEASDDRKRRVAPGEDVLGGDEFDVPAAEEGTMLMPNVLGVQHSAEELRDRISETVRTLGQFAQHRDEGADRREYLQILRNDLMELFEYNEFLIDQILDMFPPHEAVEFLEAMEKERPVTIRTNTIKAKRRDLVQALTKRGMVIEPLEKWSKVGLQVFESNIPVSGTIEYLAGHYMVQAAASFLPVMALAPQENEKVLDMSAAPGGKTTYLCALMKNTGVVFANDVSEPRIKALNGNIQRLGVTNAVVTNYDGVGFDKVCKTFDRCLLDAPCTGTGIISRDKSIKQSKQAEDIQRMGQLQRRLLLSAIDCVSAKSETGGYIVYSTCSFMVEEDEAVVDYVLRKRHVEIVDMGLPFGRPGFTKYRHHRFHPSVAESRRFFPHVHNMDGFYVCKLRKLKDGPKDEAEGLDEEKGETKLAATLKTKRQMKPTGKTKVMLERQESKLRREEKKKQSQLKAKARKAGVAPAATELPTTNSTVKLSVPPTADAGVKRDAKGNVVAGKKKPAKGKGKGKKH